MGGSYRASLFLRGGEGGRQLFLSGLAFDSYREAYSITQRYVLTQMGAASHWTRPPTATCAAKRSPFWSFARLWMSPRPC